MTDQKPSSAQSSFGYHRYECLLSCPQRYSYAYNLGLSAQREPEPLACGSLFHLGHMHWRLGQLGRPEARDPFEAMKTAPANISFVYPRVEPVFRAYIEKYKTEDFQLLDTEREYAIKIGGNPFTCRIDTTVLKDGSIYFMDVKTGGAPIEKLTLGYDMSGQLIGQNLVGVAVSSEIYGYPFGGIVLDFVRIAAQREFDRRQVRVPMSLWQPFADSIVWANAVLKQQEGKDAWNWPRNYGACVGRYGSCKFVALCKQGKFALDEYECT